MEHLALRLVFDLVWGCIWGFAKITDTFLGVPIIRILAFGVHIGVPVFRETTKSIQGLGCLSPNKRLIPHWSVSVDSSLNGEPRLGKVCSGLSR